MNYEYYGHPQLANLALQGTPGPVKTVPFHPGIVLAYVNREWLTCKSKWYDELQHAPEFVRRAVFEEYLLEKRRVTLAHHEFGLNVAEVIERLNDKALNNKEAWKAADTKDLYDLFGSVVSAAGWRMAWHSRASAVATGGRAGHRRRCAA